MDDKTAEELLEWLVLNHHREMTFPIINDPEVPLVPLLDKIAELRGIDKLENGKQYNAIADRLEKERKETSSED